MRAITAPLARGRVSGARVDVPRWPRPRPRTALAALPGVARTRRGSARAPRRRAERAIRPASAASRRAQHPRHSRGRGPARRVRHRSTAEGTESGRSSVVAGVVVGVMTGSLEAVGVPAARPPRVRRPRGAPTRPRRRRSRRSAAVSTGRGRCHPAHPARPSRGRRATRRPGRAAAARGARARRWRGTPGSRGPRPTSCAWIWPARSGRSSQAIAYSSTAGPPMTATTTAMPRTMSGSMPRRAAIPAQTPPIHPVSRTRPIERIQRKKPCSGRDAGGAVGAGVSVRTRRAPHRARRSRRPDRLRSGESWPCLDGPGRRAPPAMG